MNQVFDNIEHSDINMGSKTNSECSITLSNRLVESFFAVHHKKNLKNIKI